jgi:AcrR family transcriptional regulator
MRKRLARVEQAEDTRRRLLDAAKKVFVRRGFHGATLDEVAEEAGFTKGAVYSRFDSKADLFLALLQHHVDERIASIQATAAQPTPEAAQAALGREWPARMRKDLAWSMLVIEFRLHAARVPALNKRYGELHGRLLAVIAATIGELASRSGTVHGLSAPDAARALVAFGTGAVLERAVQGEAFSDAIIQATFEAIGLGSVALAAAAAPEAALAAAPAAARRRAKA